MSDDSDQKQRLCEMTIHIAARRALFDALADIIRHWGSEETEDYLVAKMVLVQWVEPDDNRNRARRRAGR